MDPYQKIIDDLVKEAGAASTTLPSPLTRSESGAEPSLQRLTVPAGHPRPPHEEKRIVYFDLEIKNDLSLIGGWEGAKTHGGIGLLCLWDSEDEIPHFYDGDTIRDAVQLLEKADCVVSFNGIGFDLHVIRASLGRDIGLGQHVDLFDLVKEQLDRFGKPWRGHGLDAIAQNTLGRGKIGKGSDVPGLLQQGKWAEVANYCLRDVILTRDLLTFARRNGFVLDKDGEQLNLRLPEWMRLPKEG